MHLQEIPNLDFSSESTIDPTQIHQEPQPLAPPGPDAVDVSPGHDGGVLKQITRVGVNDEHPLIGDRVLVHYDALLINGQRIDSSRFRSDSGFEFVLGKGVVVKAWDIGVATMCFGEKARFFCRNSYVDSEHFGSHDNEQSQNGETYSIVYDVELLSWQGEDITKRKDGGVLRSVLQKGCGRETPNDGSTCEVYIRGQCNGRVFEDHEVQFIMGEGSEMGVVSGVELALKKCKKGERLRLHVKSRYAYKSEGCLSYSIPPNTDLVYDVELKDFARAKDFWELDIVELLSSAQDFKDRGTHYFQMGKYELALSRYKKIVRFLRSETNVSSDHREDVRKHLVSAHLNMSLCYLKLNDDVRARESSTSSLDLDPGNVKALYRRGQANLNLQCLAEAEQDFLAVLKLDPNSKSAQLQLVATRQKQAEILAFERSTFAGMFEKFASCDKQRDNNGRNQSDVFSDVGHWSNDLASGMMTLEQEMAAFGEKMPEPRYRNNDKENEEPLGSDDDDDD